MSFDAQRKAFDTLRERAPQEACKEYVRALEALIYRYNTSVRENRFIVGGAVEVFTCGLLRAAGVMCTPCGNDSVGGDLTLDEQDAGQGDLLISLKSSFVGGPVTIGIVNKLGPNYRPWTVPTFFVLADVGIVYGDPSMVEKSELKDKPDQLALPKPVLERFIEDPDNVFGLPIVRKPKVNPSGAWLASEAVAYDIIRRSSLNVLREALPPLLLRSESVSDSSDPPPLQPRPVPKGDSRRSS